MKKGKFGIIDLGSNSLRLLVGEVEKGTPRLLRRELRETRLGERLAPGGTLYPPAKERTLEALLRLLEAMGEEQVETGIIVATSAVREASDGKQFLEDVAAVSPFPVRLLSGEEEAVYGFRGAVRSAGAAGEEEDVLVLDLGGRSTELSWQENGLCRGMSMPLGAVSIKERFLPEVTAENTRKIQDHTRKIMEEKAVLLPVKRRKKLIGLGGTITTLAALSLNLREYDPQRVHGFCLWAADIGRWENVFMRSGHRERMEMMPFSPNRADIIPAGTSVLLGIVNYLEYKCVVVSEGGLLQGLLSELYGIPFLESI